MVFPNGGGAAVLLWALLVFPNGDGAVVLLWVVFVFCDPKRPPVFGLALEELAGGLAKKEL